MWLKVLAGMLGAASFALAWNQAAREVPDQKKEARRAELQKERIDKCLKQPGEIDMTLDSFGDFAGCTIKVKRP